MTVRKSFKDSLKALEADIQHANTLALSQPRKEDGACFQMRLSYGPAAHFLLFFVQWADCQLASSLGLLRVLIYMTYVDGKTTMSVHERRATIREFYAIIYPSLLQLESGITCVEERKQEELCSLRFSRNNSLDRGKLTEADIEREEECGICMEPNSKVVLPNCGHVLCMKCYQDWRRRSQSCPFCRDNLKGVKLSDLWIVTDDGEIVNLSIILRENLQRLFLYIEKLPLLVPDPAYNPCNSQIPRKPHYN